MEENKFSFDSNKKILTHVHTTSEDLISPINKEKRGHVKSETTRKFNGEEAIREFAKILERNKVNAQAQIKQKKLQIEQVKAQTNIVKDEIKDLEAVSKQQTDFLTKIKRQVPAELLKEPEPEPKEEAEKPKEIPESE